MFVFGKIWMNRRCFFRTLYTQTLNGMHMPLFLHFWKSPIMLVFIMEKFGIPTFFRKFMWLIGYVFSSINCGFFCVSFPKISHFSIFQNTGNADIFFRTKSTFWPFPKRLHDSPVSSLGFHHWSRANNAFLSSENDITGHTHQISGLIIQNPRSVAVNHAGLWIRRHQFESGRGYRCSF